MIRVGGYIFFIFSFIDLKAQENLARYRIEFTDKDYISYSLSNPKSFLTARSLERRARQGIEVNFTDLPVSSYYIDSLNRMGLKVLNQSKWFNMVLVDYADSATVAPLNHTTFISRVIMVKPFDIKSGKASAASKASGPHPLIQDYGDAYQQIKLHNGHLLHNSGFTGKGINIAVIDAGFLGTDTLALFRHLYQSGRYLGSRDFVHDGFSVYQSSSHGTSVASIMAGYLPASYQGAAPHASYLLLRSEEVATEYTIEEDNWVAAVEYADSLGIDIINTSLGYTTFDDSTQNYTYADMDGRTALISRAGNMAAAKGMLVVNSAGNQGNSAWRYISAPADADSVLAVGAVNIQRALANFSSRGPTPDGRVKPNVCATGWGTYVSTSSGVISQGNGTSFSAPVISGLAACLWQANPSATAMDIFRALEQSADSYDKPDDGYGFGIPDLMRANLLLKYRQQPLTDKPGRIRMLPNPFTSEVYLAFEASSGGEADIVVYSYVGKWHFSYTTNVQQGTNFLLLKETDRLPQGLFLVHIRLGDQVLIGRVVRQ